MKKFLSVIALIMVLVLSVSCFVACGEPTNDDNGSTDQVTISWYQGSKLLKEEKIDKGSKATSWEPTAEGKTFTGWYKEASLAQPFDFEAAINEDTDIFAAFKSDEFVEDTNSYYLIGNGAGDMSKANWDHNNAAANLTMTKENVEKANVYTITIKMYAGDMFQICYGGSWDGQVGIGLVAGAEYCDGVNFNDNGTYTAADKKVAQVKNAAGEVVFIGSDQYDNGYEVWNVKLAEGMDGIYKITYTTYPNAGSYNQITYELVEKIQPMTVTHDMYLIGSFNNWTASDADYAMKASDDKSSWTATLTVTEDMYVQYDGMEAPACAFKIYNGVNGAYLDNQGGSNICLTAGTYIIKYTVEGDVIEIAKCAYYVVGTLLDADGKPVNYAVKVGVSPELTVSGNTATVEFVAYDATGCADYSWMTTQEKTDANGVPAIISIKVVYGSELGIATWYSAANDDNWYLSAGTYTITLDIETGTVTIA